MEEGVNRWMTPPPPHAPASPWYSLFAARTTLHPSRCRMPEHGAPVAAMTEFAFPVKKGELDADPPKMLTVDDKVRRRLCPVHWMSMLWMSLRYPR